jgi:3'(2'), 5'-bisphosphate nucleotidase
MMIAPGASLIGGAGRLIAVRTPPSAGLVALVSRSHPDTATEAYLSGFRVAERRAMGSALKFCLLAQGDADLYPRLGRTCEWDIAAGHAILCAAGGNITTPIGQSIRYGNAAGGFHQNGFVASSGFLNSDGRAYVKI